MVVAAQTYGLIHDHRVRGVKAAGDISRGNGMDRLFIPAQGVSPERLTHIAVDVNELRHV